MRTALLGAVLVGGLIFLLAKPAVGLFNKQADPEVLRLGMLSIRLQCLALPIHALGSVVGMFYAGVGKAKAALAINTARQGYCFFPALFILPLLLGINGVASTQAAADLLSAAAIVPLGLRAGKLIRERETAAA